jgi:putative hemolysin
VNRGIRVLLFVLGGLLLVGLIGVLVFLLVLAPARSSKADPVPAPGLPNPASAFCEEQGGRLEIRTADEGEYGVCVFADGSECDEWSFYRGECGPASGKASVPSLSLSAETLAPGQTVEATGTGFAPGTEVSVRLGAPKAGLGKENLAEVVVDEGGRFQVAVTLPGTWPGTQIPIVDYELVVAAVDESGATTLAVAPLLNTAAPESERLDDGAILSRDAALAYVAAHYDQPVPGPEPGWELTSLAESMAVEGSPGSVICQFTAGDWNLTVSYSVGGPEPMHYAVELSNLVTGFAWTGTADAAGQVTE